MTWHESTEDRTDVGRVLPRLVTDARVAAGTAQGQDRRAATPSWPTYTPWRSTKSCGHRDRAGA